MIELALASPFWEDSATLSITGEDSRAVLRICIAALQAADYSIEVRDADGELSSVEELLGDEDGPTN